jgi:hypothetical protein
VSVNAPVPRIDQASAKPDEFRIYTSKPDVRFLSKAVQPPATVYVAVADDLAVSCATSQASEVITVSYRLLRFDGELVLGQFTVRPASNRTVILYQESLAEGFLLSVSCKAAVATTRGQTFVRIFLTNPSLGNGQPSYVLMADYVTTQMSPAHPGGRVLAPNEGPGYPYVISFSSPGVGTFFSTIVPTNVRWKLRSTHFAFTTSAVVANRNVYIQAISGGGTIFYGYAVATQTAGLAVQYTGMPLWPASQPFAGHAGLPIPPETFLKSGDTVNIGANLLDGGDNIPGVRLYVEEWLDNV